MYLILENYIPVLNIRLNRLQFSGGLTGHRLSLQSYRHGTRSGKMRQKKKTKTKTKQEQGWDSGESTLLPPMRPGFKYRRRRNKWVEFIVASILSFAPRDPLRGCATDLQINIYYINEFVLPRFLLVCQYTVIT